ncbi:metallophosphoesterase [Halomonas sp. BN3-1]|uniref:metallophosphoesterase n=1 Tax=Halomonas sp. BN3-1 TaxID=2082393 RepID=UPI000D385D53|nr:metallophosphoesterase [Halomonas sp. BN3-1]|tara:strand:- start:7284 stop:7949 length:666 start_codon:yes stop_codon:yes gene_type:complete
MSLITKHEVNTNGRDFFVGDIHGQYALLMEAMARVEFDKTRDRLFSVGDLIDRGSESLECLSLAFEPWFFGVRGNHEMLAYDALNEGAGQAWDLWQINGGSWVYLHGVHEVRTILNAALEHQPYAREVEVEGKHIGMVHAEPPHDWHLLQLEDHSAGLESLVWGRKRIRQMDTTLVANVDAVVVGHTILKQPETLGNVHYIDTGAFSTGLLTLIEARAVLS